MDIYAEIRIILTASKLDITEVQYNASNIFEDTASKQRKYGQNCYFEIGENVYFW